MTDLVYFLLLGHAALVAIIAVVVSECRHWQRRYNDEKDLSQRLIGHLSRIQSERSANIVPFSRGRK